VQEKPLHLQQRNKTILANSTQIRSVLAGIFLVLFAFGITPRLTLHNLVANHKDGRLKSSLPDPNSNQLSKAGFNCQCDNTIIESPFLQETVSQFVITVSAFEAYKNIFTENVFSSQEYCSSLRGPPAC
jgi:hypothetical protein